jgi:hypothetical protein
MEDAFLVTAAAGTASEPEGVSVPRRIVLPSPTHAGLCPELNVARSVTARAGKAATGLGGKSRLRLSHSGALRSGRHWTFLPVDIDISSGNRSRVAGGYLRRPPR